MRAKILITMIVAFLFLLVVWTPFCAYSQEATPFAGTAEEIIVLPDTCAKDLAAAVQDYSKHVKQEYAKELSEIVCAESKAQDIDPILVASIIYSETKWIRQTKCGKFGCGPMQITGHNAKHLGYARKDMLDLTKGVNAGIKMFHLHKENVSSYNGSTIKGYTSKVRRIYEALKLRIEK